MLWCCRSSRVTCQQASTRQPGWSTRDSSPRRNCWATRCSTAGATPVPSAAAAQAAVWLGKTLIWFSGMPRPDSIWPVSLSGSVPEASTNHSHWRGPPRSRDWRALIRYGAIFFLLEKLGAVVGTTNLHIYAAMRGESLEVFQKTRNAQVLYSVAGQDQGKKEWDKTPAGAPAKSVDPALPG